MAANNAGLVLLWAVCAMACGCTSSRGKLSETGVELVRRNEAVQEIVRIALAYDAGQMSFEEGRAESVKCFSHIESSDDVASVSMACQVLTESYRIDVGPGQILEEAFWIGVSTLASRTDATAVLQLATIQREYGKDGGDARMLNLAVLHQRRLRGLEPDEQRE